MPFREDRTTYTSAAALLANSLSEGDKWTLLLDDGTEWTSGTVDRDGLLVPHPFAVTREDEFFPMSNLEIAPITDLVLNAGGTGYAAGDVGKTLTITPGTFTTAATATIATVGGGAVTGVTFADGGTGYTTGVSAGAATTGAGNNDCTLDPVYQSAEGCGCVEPLQNGDLIEIDSTGLVLTPDGSNQPWAKLPWEMNRPFIFELNNNTPLTPTTTIIAWGFLRSKAATMGSQDFYGLYLHFDDPTWEVLGVKYDDGGVSSGGTVTSGLAATADRRLAMWAPWTTVQATSYFSGNAWSYPTTSWQVRPAQGANVGVDYTDVTETFFPIVYGAGTGTTTVVGARCTDTQGQGFS